MKDEIILTILTIFIITLSIIYTILCINMVEIAIRNNNETNYMDYNIDVNKI